MAVRGPMRQQITNALINFKPLESGIQNLGNALATARNRENLATIGEAAKGGNLAAGRDMAFEAGMAPLAMQFGNALAQREARAASAARAARAAEENRRRFELQMAENKRQFDATHGLQQQRFKLAQARAASPAARKLPPRVQEYEYDMAQRRARGDTKLPTISEWRKEQKVKPKAQSAARLKINEMLTQSDVVTKNIDRAMKLSKSTMIDRDTPFLNIGTGQETTVGLAGAATAGIPGTDSYDLKSALEQIKANIGFDKLQAMREASPTGGALGQVSNFEVRQLQAVMGNLDQFQSAKQLRDALTTVRKIVTNRRKNYIDAYKKDFDADFKPEESGALLSDPAQTDPSATLPGAGPAQFAAPGLGAARAFTYVPGQGLIPKE